MFNFIEEAETYLNGNNVDIYAMDYIIYVLSKYYKYKDYDMHQCRIKIKNWMNRYNYYLNGDYMNDIIVDTYSSKIQLPESIVSINESDIEAINNCVDKKQSKRVALWLVVYGKFQNLNSYDIRIRQMAKWVRIDKSHLYCRQLKELADFDFIKINNFGYQKYLKNEKLFLISIQHNLINEGQYKIEHNNEFDGLFHQIFG